VAKCVFSLGKRRAGIRSSIYTKSENALAWNCGSALKVQMLHECRTVVNNEE
jgi:hypothetical protein